MISFLNDDDNNRIMEIFEIVGITWKDVLNMSDESVYVRLMKISFMARKGYGPFGSNSGYSWNLQNDLERICNKIKDGLADREILGKT